MAKEKTASSDQEPVRDWHQQVSLSLTPSGGRLFVHGATADRPNRATVEIKCRHRPSLSSFGLGVIIGEQKHKKPPIPGRKYMPEADDQEETGWAFTDCAVMLEVYEVDQKWLDEQTKRKDGQPIVGRMHYHDPIQTADGVVNEVYPKVTAWVGMGTENFRLVRDRLIANDIDDLDLGITVQLPEGTVDHGWNQTTVQWDGKGALPIVEAVAVWRRQDWSSDEDDREARRQIRYGSEEIYEPETPYTPSREQVDLMAGVGRIEAGIERLMIPLWGAVVALVVIAARLLR